MTRVSPPWGTKAWTNSRSKRRASSRADQRARLKTAWNRLKWRSCSCPVARSAAATVRHQHVRYVDEQIKLPGCEGPIRQLAVDCLGRDRPTLFLSNHL